MHWRKKRQPTPVFLPGESQGLGSLVGCHLWGRRESEGKRSTFPCAFYKLKDMGSLLTRNTFTAPERNHTWNSRESDWYIEMEIQRKVMEEGNWDGREVEEGVGGERTGGRGKSCERMGRVMKIIISVTASFHLLWPSSYIPTTFPIMKGRFKVKKALSFLV